MGNISIEINNREFLIACTDGDEEKVKSLALKFASRVKSIKESCIGMLRRMKGEKLNGSKGKIKV